MLSTRDHLRFGLSGPRRGRRPQLLVVEHDPDQRAAREPVVKVLALADPRAGPLGIGFAGSSLPARTLLMKYGAKVITAGQAST